MKTKKFTVEMDYDLSEKFKAIAQKRGMTLRQIQERMVQNTIDADRIAEEIRG